MKKAIDKINNIIDETKSTSFGFAKLCGIDPAVIHRILNRKVHSTGGGTMEKIYKGTKGKVTPNDFFDFVKPKIK